MTVTVLRSTAGGAPTLVNSAGSLLTLLDYILVTNLSWTKPYTGTNKAAYKMPSGTNERYLRVDDTGTTSARVVGYETMSDVNTGTGPFPTAVQMSGGLYWPKSSTGTAAPWIALSDGALVYLFIKYDNANWQGVVFGDFDSYKASDAFNTLIVGETSAPSSFATNIDDISASTSTVATGHYIARSYTQVGSSITCGKVSDATQSGTTMGSTGMTYPSPLDGALHLAPVWLTQASATIGKRGLLPGIWNPLHLQPLAHGDTFSGTGDLTGRSFEVITFQSGQVFIETSDTWGGF